MAIFHFSTKTFSRSSGQNAVAAAAYRAGARYVDQKTKTVADYRKKRHVDVTFVVCPGDVFVEPEKLWNAAEAAENRKNSTVAREYEMALPVELSNEAQERLAREIAEFISKKYGVAGQGSIHRIKGNPHFHYLTTTRSVGVNGLTTKTRVLDDRKTGSVEIKKMREHWADICNRELKLQNCPARVDPRSNEERGIKALPAIHEGVSATALKKRSAYSVRASENARRKEINHLKESAMDEFRVAHFFLQVAEQNHRALEMAQKKAAEPPKEIFTEKSTANESAPEKPKKSDVPKKPQKTAGRKKLEIELDRLRKESNATPWSGTDFDRETVEKHLMQKIERARTAAARAKKKADALRSRYKIRDFLGFPNSKTRAAIATAKKLKANVTALKKSLPTDVRNEIAARKSENKKWLAGEGATLMSQANRLDFLLNNDEPAIRRAVDAGNHEQAQTIVDRQNSAFANQIKREIAWEKQTDQPLSAPTGPDRIPEPGPEAPGF